MKIVKRGISLMEVILAIGILGASLAALSSVVMNGANASLDARDRAVAQMQCEQQMAQVLIANIHPLPVIDQPIPSLDPSTQLLLNVQSTMAPLNGLLVVKVSVSAGPTDLSRTPVTVSLMRWMIDPNLGLEQAEADEKAAEEEAAAAASSSASSGSAPSGASGGAP